MMLSIAWLSIYLNDVVVKELSRKLSNAQLLDILMHNTYLCTIHI